MYLQKIKILGLVVLSILASCKVPNQVSTANIQSLPDTYQISSDSISSASLSWKDYFQDKALVALIDTALQHNQELLIMGQELEQARSEIRIRKGEYLPFLGLGAGAGIEKRARYTTLGASEATTEIEPGVESPEPLGDYFFGARASWELDIWKKLRNGRKKATMEYLASAEGRNFMQTNLIAEIANAYYELLAYDNQLAIVQRNLEIQQKAFRIVKQQKSAAKVTELAVQKFQAELFKNQSKIYYIQQYIVETENELNRLLGQFPREIIRKEQELIEQKVQTINHGIPAQLIENRADIKQAELELEAAKLDVKIARANFYPSLGINFNAGFQAYDPGLILESPASLAYNLGADLMAPLINRNALKAELNISNSKQVQAALNYERVLINAFLEVSNQLAKLDNMQQSLELKQKEVQALNRSNQVSNVLFQSARADYMEVLLTQRDALEAKFELVETKKEQMHAMVDIYRALGGGWR